MGDVIGWRIKFYDGSDTVVYTPGYVFGVEHHQPTADTPNDALTAALEICPKQRLSGVEAIYAVREGEL